MRTCVFVYVCVLDPEPGTFALSYIRSSLLIYLVLRKGLAKSLSSLELEIMLPQLLKQLGLQVSTTMSGILPINSLLWSRV